MDDGVRNAYVAGAMNLLLLLSALLSALTGAGLSARRFEVAPSVAAQTVAVHPARVAPAIAAQRPMASLPTLVVSARLWTMATPILLGTSDLWATRRRE